MRPAEASAEAWGAIAAALKEGRPLKEACAGSGLDRAAAARLTARWAGAWVDLLDRLEGTRVLLAEHSPGLAGMRVAAEAAVLGYAEINDTRAQFVSSWLGGQPAELVIDTEARLSTDKGPWDIIVVDGLPTSGREDLPSLDVRLRRLAAGLAPQGRLVVVCDNRVSPLRAADRAVGRLTGPSGPSLKSIERALRKSGVGLTQRFALLRSSIDGVTAFDLDAPEAASAILTAAAVNIQFTRAMGLRILRRLARQPEAAALVVPAWMVLASSPTSAWASSPCRPTGRLGHKWSWESKLLRGEPPVELEKRCPTPEAAAREAMALRELETRGLRLAPRLLAQPAPDRLRQTWLPGHPLRPAGLPRDQLQVWVGRAGQTLGAIQRATKRSDGTVLVHGDYWLGNLLVDGDDVVAVLDWTAAHWGDPAEDLDYLIDNLVKSGFVWGDQIAMLTEVARAAQAAA